MDIPTKSAILVVKRSMLTGKVHSRVIPISAAEYEEWRVSRSLIQNTFPHLSADDREFLISGITPEEWDQTFNKG